MNKELVDPGLRLHLESLTADERRAVMGYLEVMDREKGYSGDMALAWLAFTAGTSNATRATLQRRFEDLARRAAMQPDVARQWRRMVEYGKRIKERNDEG